MGGNLFSALSPWNKHELSPALQIRVRKGHRVAVKNVGTAAKPAWLVTPKRKQPVSDDASGAIPFLVPLATSAASALGRGAARRQALKADPWKTSITPGDSVVFEGVGALLIDSDGIAAHV